MSSNLLRRVQLRSRADGSAPSTPSTPVSMYSTPMHASAKSNMAGEQVEIRVNYQRMLRGLLFRACMVSLVLKFMLLCTYQSTDFEVHRNWKAITHSLPMNRWYHESTSVWTLDYPPFFAFLEYLLSWPARLFDPQMLEISEAPYQSWSATVYMNITVMVLDGLLYISAIGLLLIKPIKLGLQVEHQTDDGWLIALVFMPGLFILDHIHFQYNGFMVGLLLLSLTLLTETHRDGEVLLGAALFSSLLCMKHLYITLAPAVLIHCLTNYVLVNGVTERDRSIVTVSAGYRFLSLALVVLSVVFLAFSPFILLSADSPTGELGQIFRRLLPFDERGLIHTYWAGNAWAPYVAVDRVLSRFIRLLPTSLQHSGLFPMSWLAPPVPSGLTRGIIGEVLFHILPSPRPWHCLLLTLVSSLPALAQLCNWSHSKTDREADNGKPAMAPLNSPRPTTPGLRRAGAVTGTTSAAKASSTALFEGAMRCSLSAYFFGWHVHEKASLTFTVLLLALAALPFLRNDESTRTGNRDRQLRADALLAVVGSAMSYLPLIPESPSKLAARMLIVFGGIVTLKALRFPDFGSVPVFHRVLLIGSVMVELFFVFVPTPLVPERLQSMEFLPYLIHSLYAAMWTTHLWLRHCWIWALSRPRERE
eukprot:Clim_evm59s77 gene=Clim_evmTU59s77